MPSGQKFELQQALKVAHWGRNHAHGMNIFTARGAADRIVNDRVARLTVFFFFMTNWVWHNLHGCQDFEVEGSSCFTAILFYSK